MEVSKELLSEVLGEDVRIGTYIKADVDEDEPVQYTMRIEIYGNKVSYWRYYKEWDDGITMVKCNVNIYELAHKCKEWALKHDCELLSCIKSTRALCDIYSNTYNCKFTHYAETEIEAVVKACQWILERINEKQL